jgi:hypothetical protein
MSFNQTWVDELPLVAAFVFFCLTLIKIFLDFLKARDKDWSDKLAERDDKWQKFLKEQRGVERATLGRLTEEIQNLSERHQEHDQAMKSAILIMKERTRPGARHARGARND